MLKRILSYAVIFLITLYFFFMYNDEIVKAVIAIEVVYFLVFICYVIYAHYKVTGNMVSKGLIGEKNKEVSVSYRITNKSKMFPVIYREVFLVENLSTGKNKRYRRNGIINKSATKLLLFPVTIKEFGNIRVTFEQIELFDYLFLLKSVKKVKESCLVGVLPDTHLIPLEITRKTRDFIAEADEYSDKERGDDPSETFQIREYQKGDSIHDIHWKMSAKEDEIMIKENGKPMGAVVLLWLDLDKNRISKGEYSKKLFRKKKSNMGLDTALVFEMVASVSMSLLEEKCVHMVAWYEKENNRISLKKISKEEHIYELLHRLFFVESYKKTEAVDVLYKDTFKGVEFSTIVNLCINGDVYIGDEKIEVPKVNNKIVWEQLYMKL